MEIKYWEGIPCDISFTVVEEGIRQFKENFKTPPTHLMLNSYYFDSFINFTELHLALITNNCLYKECFILISNYLDLCRMLIGPTPIEEISDRVSFLE